MEKVTTLEVEKLACEKKLLTSESKIKRILDSNARTHILLNTKGEKLKADNLEILEKKDTEIKALLEKLAVVDAALDRATNKWHEHLQKGISDFGEVIKRLQEIHNTEVSALNLSYQELNKNSKHNLTQKDARIKELEGEVASVKRGQEEAILPEALISKLEKSRETCKGLVALCAEYEKEKGSKLRSTG